MTFPDGWRIETTSRGIVGFSRTADAALTFATAKPVRGQTLEQYLETSMALDIREGREVTVAGMRGYLAIIDRMESGFGPRPSRVLLLADSRRPILYLFQGSGKHDLRKIAADREFIATIFSFDTMSREELLTIKEPKLQVLRVEAGTTMEDLAEQSPITSYPLQTLRVINGLYPDGEPEEGQLIKVID
jgi:predicted Zn-dependent protease